MSVAELRQTLTNRLAELGKEMDQYQKLQLALNMKLSAKTIERYTSGDTNEVRKLELAELMIEAALKITVDKNLKTLNASN